MITFGEFVRNLRIDNSLTLREFCRITKLDPSNWSKTERNLAPPPKSKPILQMIADTLNLQERSEDYNTFFDLAAITFIPTDLVSDQKVVEKLPIFFRTLRGEKPSRKELEELVKILEKD